MSSYVKYCEKSLTNIAGGLSKIKKPTKPMSFIVL